MKELLFGAAYYDEYMPYERLEQDIALMKKAGINTVRIAESTWSTCEPQEGCFDFSHVEKVMDAMEGAGIHVIIGTPTYAIPTWMAKSYPDVLAETSRGRGIYGARQIMDITHPAYLFYAERVIRKLMERTAHRECVIGFQLDNETKHYGTAGKNVQEQFVKYLREKFNNRLDALNKAFGLDYWSNRINAWEDFPDVRGTINGSLGAEFEKFQRSLVSGFLGWQAGIVREYCREEQFITHNLDFEWRGHSFGVQPKASHFQISKCLTVCGADIYHPSQDELTGAEIAFGGDLIRSLKQDNYLLLETEAQGFPNWIPYQGQLRLQAYSHLASGSNSVMYWHWHSIHNSYETYWKGLLSHDFQENDTYREACEIGREFSEIGSHLVNLKKENQAAILVSNESLTALEWFQIQATSANNGSIGYNDVVRWIYDALYQMNVECDFLWPESENFSQYKVIFVPALYAAPDSLLLKLRQYTAAGGTLVATFKTGFSDENVKVSHKVQPRLLTDCFGIKYHQFAFPKNVRLCGKAIAENAVREAEASVFMELLISESAEVLAYYEHYNWKNYAAATKNKYKKGTAIYLGCMTDRETLKNILRNALQEAQIPLPKETYPVILRKGVNDLGKTVRYYLNYSPKTQQVRYGYKDGICLLKPKGWGAENNILTSKKALSENTAASTEISSDGTIASGKTLTLPPWGLCIVEESIAK